MRVHVCVCLCIPAFVCVCVSMCAEVRGKLGEEGLLLSNFTRTPRVELRSPGLCGKAPLSVGPSHLPKLTVSKADSENGITYRVISGVLRTQHILGGVGESIQNPLSNQEAHTDHSAHLVHSYYYPTCTGRCEGHQRHRMNSVLPRVYRL